MRPLATLFLVLGIADLAVVDFVIGPVAVSGGVESRGLGIGDRTQKASLPPGSVASVRPEPQPLTPPPVPVPDPDPDPNPDPVSDPDPNPDPVSDPDPDPDPDPVPDPVPVPVRQVLPPTPPTDHIDALPAPVTLHFDLDSDRLGSRSRGALERVAAILEDRADLAVAIDGHADESGSQDHNQTLSERRAQAVAEYLQGRGIEATRLTVQAFGELEPIDPARAAERDRRNRRVEIRFASQNATGDTE